MKKVILLLCGFLMMTQLIAQKTVNDYSYVVVPDQYEFTQGKDVYQLNSMTNFYLNKSGFISYMKDEAPNTNRCDGLFADVEKVKSLLTIKLVLILKDCQGNILYRSPEGKSKQKEFKKGYQDALRKAFVFVAAENFKQTEMVINKEVIEVEVKKSIVKETDDSKTIKTKVAVTKEVASNNEIKTVTVTKTENKEKEVAAVANPKTTSTVLIPSARFSSYALGAKTFLLRKTTDGYSLYEETTDAGDGLLLLGTLTVADTIVTFMDTAGNKADAYFDTSKNLIITQGETSRTYTFTN